MTTPIRIGEIARTVGPLKPTGKVHVKGQTLDATSEGLWIDSNSDVVIAGGHTGRVVVRPVAEQYREIEHHGQPLPEPETPVITPLQSPDAWVERINAVVIGVVAGCLVIPLVWLGGTPLDISAALVPIAGGIAGRLFQAFVGSAIQSAGPREDHRPAAVGIAGMVLVCAVIGAAIGLHAVPGFVALSIGLAVGALVGGFMSWIGMIVYQL